MKYTAASILALASLSASSPLPQFFLPSFPRPTGGFSLPTAVPNLPPSLPTNIGTPPTATTVPGNGNTGGDGGSVGGNCTPQGTRGGSSENGITDKSCCTALTIIFARGTGEMGNVGMITGPPMFNALRERLGADKVTVQGVEYPASPAGNLQLGASGGPAMAALISSARSQCPDTKIVVSGYSQGAMVVHNALGSGSGASGVAGAVLFGDPLIRQDVGSLGQDKVKQFCGTTDTICGQPAGGVNGGHLSYGSVASQAAEFVVGVTGLA